MGVREGVGDGGADEPELVHAQNVHGHDGKGGGQSSHSRGCGVSLRRAEAEARCASVRAAVQPP